VRTAGHREGLPPRAVAAGEQALVDGVEIVDIQAEMAIAVVARSPLPREKPLDSLVLEESSARRCTGPAATSTITRSGSDTGHGRHGRRRTLALGFEFETERCRGRTERLGNVSHGQTDVENRSPNRCPRLWGRVHRLLLSQTYALGLNVVGVPD